ncbi:hypothetical protein QZH63_02220, partial [Eikenella corrodens]|nr:hypothetical protein [Eikenella corrodens]
KGEERYFAKVSTYLPTSATKFSPPIPIAKSSKPAFCSYSFSGSLSKTKPYFLANLKLKPCPTAKIIFR